MIRLRKNWVLVKLPPPVVVSRAAIIIPPIARKTQTYGYGHVAFTGPDVKEVKVGDKVIFTEFAGREIVFEDTNYLIVKEDALLGVLEDESV